MKREERFNTGNNLADVQLAPVHFVAMIHIVEGP